MLRRWLDALLNRGRFEGEMTAEMEAHIGQRADDLMAAEEGLSRGEAERRARLEFGPVEAVKESCREARRLDLLDELWRNLRFALRHLTKNPGFTAAVVLTLGLCIGANAAVFSVVDAVLLRPLPYPQPERLAMVVTHYSSERAEGTIPSHNGAGWQAIRDGVEALQVAVYSGWPSGANLVAGGLVDHVQQQRVGAGFFEVLGVAPQLGRGFGAEEDLPGGAAVTVLSHRLWQRAYSGDTGVLGSSILLKGEPHQVVGVMPPDFHSGIDADLWTPLRPTTTGEGQGTNYAIVARLPGELPWTRAEAELAALDEAIAPHMSFLGGEVGLGLKPLKEGRNEGIERRLLIAWAMVGLVLLVGCMNVAGLLLARTANRVQEIAARMALGGGRGAIVRQLLTESLLLSLAGGLCGVLLGYLGMRWLEGQAAETLGLWQPIALDARVLGLAFLLSLVTVLLSGLFPALHAARLDRKLARLATAGGGRAIAGSRNRWPRRLLVAAQVALVTVLLVGAGLLVRTLLHLRGLEPGFSGENVVSATVSLQDVRYDTRVEVEGLFDETLRQIRRQPGVLAAGAALSLPYQRPLNMGFELPGSEGGGLITNLTYLTPGYLEALEIPLLRGRLLDRGDRADTAPVVLVNRAFVERYLAGDADPGSEAGAAGAAGDPLAAALGRRIAIVDGEREIVGVVGDVQQRPSWGGDVGPLGTLPAVYMPVGQTGDGFLRLIHTWFQPSWVVKTAGPQTGAIAALDRAVTAVDPQLPLAGFSTMEAVRETTLARERFQATLLTLGAALALIISAVGIAALIATSVAERSREMGIRIALGATRGRTIAGAALPGVLMTVGGLAAGAVLAWLAVRTLQHFLYGVSPQDAPTFAAVLLAQLAVAAVASLLPALRLSRLDPVRALKEE